MSPLLLSKRQAAKLLGVGRGNTLQWLIDEGHIRPVIIQGRVRIPLEEVQRVAREGTEAMPKPKTRKPFRRVQSDVEYAESIDTAKFFTPGSGF